VTEITDHLQDIERRISLALDRSQQRDRCVTIVAVSKRKSPAAVIEAHAAGLDNFGENYVQEGIGKMEAVAPLELNWHFIGRIQSNKTSAIAERFDWVHTLDRERVASRLSAQRPEMAPPLNVLIQLNLHREPQKGGVEAREIASLAEHIAGLPRLTLRGLMSMPPAGLDADESREHFLQVVAEADRLQRRGFDIDTLSMGMSRDFELAVECGATCVRIGTALFGARDP
jgi:pyridoxal phosphate enzyme (YggS family)